MDCAPIGDTSAVGCPRSRGGALLSLPELLSCSLLATALALSSPGSVQQLSPDETITLEVGPEDPELEGHGPSRTFEHEIGFAGVLYVWAASAELDPFLRVEDARGAWVTEDDDSGGGTSAQLAINVRPGMVVAVTVATADAGVAGRVALRLSEAPDSEAARAAAERVRLAIAEAAEASRNGDLPAARASLAAALSELGSVDEPQRSHALGRIAWELGKAAYEAREFGTARGAVELALAFRTRTLADEHRNLQSAREMLSVVLKELGELAEARVLQEKVLEVRSRTLDVDDPSIQTARLNLAVILEKLGDLQGARVLEVDALANLSRRQGDEHPHVLTVREDLAITLKELGALAEARALQETVLEVRLRTLPEEHDDVQRARINLANTLRQLGDPAAARALQERVLQIWSRVLSDDDRFLLAARSNLANTMTDLGDLDGARALSEEALAGASRALPADDPHVQAARVNLAVILIQLGDHAGARALAEQSLEVCERTLPDGSPTLQTVRECLANALSGLGEPVAARALREKILDARSRALPADSFAVQSARMNLAVSMKAAGDLAGALALERQALEVWSRTLGGDDATLGLLRMNVARTLARMKDDAGVRSTLAELAEGTQASLVTAARTLSSREAEASASRRASAVSMILSHGAGATDAAADAAGVARAFSLVETARAVGLASARWARFATRGSTLESLQASARRVAEALAREVSDRGDASTLAALAREREGIQRQILDLARESPGTSELETMPTAEALAARLDDSAAAVGFWRYAREDLASRSPAIESLLAFVLRADGSVTRVELGPVAPIAAAIDRWRSALGAAPDSRGMLVVLPLGSPGVEELGEGVRERVFDPLRGALGDARAIVVAPDDVLHLVPLDALPSSDGCLGDEFAIEVRSSLRELLFESPAPEAAESLLALGDVDYEPPSLDSGAGRRVLDETTPSGTEPASAEPARRGAEPPSAAATDANPWTPRFGALPGTSVEIEGIRALFERRFGRERPVQVLVDERASRDALERIAPGVRFLHLATHGFFLPGAPSSAAEPRPLDAASGLGAFTSEGETLRGLSPMVLCGLALSGANSARDECGRLRGVITAEELSTLDLGQCELAVLSACDTHVGVRRAGQGLASLQKALHMAGARSVITSLWKVPDAATRELMVDFYRRIWIEKKPKSLALWEAKKTLRAARDEHGQPRYSVRDWGAWVLTGVPR